MEPIGSSIQIQGDFTEENVQEEIKKNTISKVDVVMSDMAVNTTCLLYTSPSPRDVEESRMPSSA